MKKNKTMRKIITILILSIFTASCTENSRAKTFGGTAKLEVPCNQKVTNITWKGEELWFSTLPMEDIYEPKTHNFREESSFGLIEGNYLLIESRCK